MSGICYIVGTPIGNLKDITLRALDTLNAVDVIASEDTRKSAVLLGAYNIKKPLISYHKHKEREGAEQIAALLQEGKSVALITDAGMPAISDPGAILVQTLRQKGIKIESVPGPTALTTAISLAGLSQNGFLFAGFLPEKKRDKDKLIDNIKSVSLPLVFYVAPHDLDDTLSYLCAKLGDRKATAAKELTKVFETIYEGNLSNLDIANRKGEFVLIVDGAQEQNKEDTDNQIATLLTKYLAEGVSRSEAIKRVALETGAPKNSVYAAALHYSAEKSGNNSGGN